MQNHYWEVGDVFVDNNRKTNIILKIYEQTHFGVINLYDNETGQWWVENDTHYVGHINPRPDMGELVMTGMREDLEVKNIYREAVIGNTIAEDLNKIK